MDKVTMEAGAAKRPTKARRTGPNGFDRGSLEKAKAAAHAAIEEAWPQFQAAIHETGGDESASIAVALRYKPGKDGKKKSVPPRVEVVGKASLPTNREVFEARDSGGQLVFSSWDLA